MNTEQQKTVVNAVIALVSCPIMIVVGLYLKGMVGMDLWNWFLVPLGVPSIGILQALGLTLVGFFFCGGLENVSMSYNLYKHTLKDDDPAKLKDHYIRWFVMVGVVVMVWIYGAIFHWLMA